MKKFLGTAKAFKWFKSRTVNWAVVLALLGAIEASTHWLRPFFDKHPQTYGIMITMLAVVMAYLRVTRRPIDRDDYYRPPGQHGGYDYQEPRRYDGPYDPTQR